MNNKIGARLLVFAILFLIGMILGPLLDGMHVHSGVLAYNEPEKIQSWWVPYLFGSATVGIGFLVFMVESFFKQNSFTATWKSALVAVLVFIIAYGFSAYSRIASWAIFIIIALFARRLGVYFIKNKPSLVIVIIVTLIGPLVEVSIISAGLFHYIRSDAFGIPLWLYPLYFCAGIAISLLYKALDYYLVSKNPS